MNTHTIPFFSRAREISFRLRSTTRGRKETLQADLRIFSLASVRVRHTLPVATRPEPLRLAPVRPSDAWSVRAMREAARVEGV